MWGTETRGPSAMRVLLIYCHPRQDSFCAALRDAARGALERLGHEVETRDLYAEGFRPAMSAEEHAAHLDFPRNVAGVEEHVAGLQAAQALVLVYPTWWYGMPAMLKGGFDRVWTEGVAFRLGAGAIQPMLLNIRRIAVVTTYGSPWWLLRVIGHPDRKLIRRGIARLCAPGCRVDWVHLTSMDQRSSEECEAFLRRVGAHFGDW